MSCVDFTFKTYGRSIMVSNNYSGIFTIKDMAHKTTLHNSQYAYKFQPMHVFSGIKEQFLANETRTTTTKQVIIILIGNLLKRQEYALHNADLDANMDIFHTLVSSSYHMHTTVIGKKKVLHVLVL